MADPEINPTEPEEPYPPLTIHTISQKLGVEPRAPFPQLEGLDAQHTPSNRGRRLGAEVLAFLAIAGPLAEGVTTAEAAPRVSEKEYVQELKEGIEPLQMLPGAVVIKEGAAQDGIGSGAKQKVEEGQAWIVRYPLVANINGKRYIGYSKYQKGATHSQTDVKNLHWFDTTSKNIKITAYVDTGTSMKDPSRNIRPGITPNGNFFAYGLHGKTISHQNLLNRKTVKIGEVAATTKRMGLKLTHNPWRYLNRPPEHVEQPGQPVPNLPDIVPQPQGPIDGGIAPTPEIPDTSPKHVYELPGFSGSEVGPEIKSSFNQSIVRVLIRRKGETGNWTDWCEGTKIGIYVYFAAHCEPTIGAPYHGDLPVGPNGVEAYDYANASEFEFTTADPNLPNDIRLRADMQTAKEEGLVMPTGNDVAVLRLQPISNPTFDAWQQQVGNQGYRSYSQISSVPFKVPVSTPTLGTQVYFNGASQHNGFRLLDSTTKQGITIGEWSGFSTSDIPQPRDMYVVATNPLNEDEDGGGFGTSGESAVTNNGELLIGLSVRANYGYLNGPPNSRESQDFFQRVINEYQQKNILLGKENGAPTILFFTKVTDQLKSIIDAAFGRRPPI